MVHACLSLSGTVITSGGIKRKAVDGGAALGPPPVKYNTAGDDADVTWSAPKNQKGDGRSKLNDKFGY
jgi:hypothetical protein